MKWSKKDAFRQLATFSVCLFVCTPSEWSAHTNSSLSYCHSFPSQTFIHKHWGLHLCYAARGGLCYTWWGISELEFVGWCGQVCAGSSANSYAPTYCLCSRAARGSSAWWETWQNNAQTVKRSFYCLIRAFLWLSFSVRSPYAHPVNDFNWPGENLYIWTAL